MFYVVVRLVSWSAQRTRVCGVLYDGRRFVREAVSGRESTLRSLYTLSSTAIKMARAQAPTQRCASAEAHARQHCYRRQLRPCRCPPDAIAWTITVQTAANARSRALRCHWIRTRLINLHGKTLVAHLAVIDDLPHLTRPTSNPGGHAPT
jgi:hypothetical protein